MPSGAGLQSKISQVLKKLNATDRVVKFRIRNSVGGDPLLGIGGMATMTDTVMNPQPSISMVSSETVASSGGVFQLGDYALTIAGTVSESLLETSTILYGEDELKIISYRPAAFKGVVAAWDVVARTSKGNA